MLCERKYDIQNNKLVKRATGIPLPENEPLFIMRAQDKLALGILGAYHAMTENLRHKEELMKVIKDFRKFERDNPDRMKIPDP